MSQKQKQALNVLKKVRRISRKEFAKRITKGDVGASVMVLKGLKKRGFRDQARKVIAA